MRKRLRKKKTIGEFATGALVIRWLAAPEIPHLKQANVLATFDHEVLEPSRVSLFPIGFGCQGEWCQLIVPTKRTLAVPPGLPQQCREWLAGRREITSFEVREFERTRDAQAAYRALLVDFDTRHPDPVA